MTEPALAREGAARGAFRRVRALSRFLGYVVINLSVALLWHAGLPFTWGSPSRRMAWRNSTFRTWARASLACTGVRLVVRGEPPRPPCVLVSNHLCYLDIWVLASATGCTFVAQSEIADWPFFGFMARQLDVLFIERTRKRAIPGVNRAIDGTLARGHVVALFPEGTTTDGSAVRPFRPSLLEPAAQGAHPIAWAAIGYRTSPPDPPASSSVCWVDDTPLATHARGILMLDAIDATLVFGSGILRGSDRKDLALELRRRVEAEFTPVV